MDQYRADMVAEYQSFIHQKEFSCIAARSALANGHIKCTVAGHIACPASDKDILQFLYSFINDYRQTQTPFHSAAVLFTAPETMDESTFDAFMWQRLQSLATLDAQQYGYDPRVDADPQSANFGFSLMEEAFFIIGLHAGSSRPSRRFKYPALVFNPHAEFEKLRANNRYGKMKDVIRKRDISYSGSANPMLTDFGEASEVYQYSGRSYAADWQCPLKIHHGTTT